jgi:hypothetical protein
LIVTTTPLLYLQYLFEPEVSLDVSVPKLAEATKEHDKAVIKQTILSIKNSFKILLLLLNRGVSIRGL